MIKVQLCIALLLCSINAETLAECVVGSNFTSGYNMPTLSTTAININKYEGSSVQATVSSREVASTNFDIFRVYDKCPISTAEKALRTIYGNVYASNLIQFAGDIYRLNIAPALGIKVEMGDAPSSATLKTLNTNELSIYSYDGDSHGVKMKVTLYVLPRTTAMVTYPTNINISNYQIATIRLRKSNGNLVASAIPVYLNASVNISESTCALRQTNYSIDLPAISIRELGTIGNETNLSGNTVTLEINCAYLSDGAGREVKAYITDAISLGNTSNALSNKTGSGYATGVGIRLRDKDNTIITLDPNQSKSTNKWTFGKLATSPTLQHVIKANYVRTANTVTAGSVQAQAYLNIVYD